MSIMAFYWIAKHAATRPDSPAVHDLLSDREYTYAELHDRVDRAALFLYERCGVSKGDRIALLMHNSSDVVELIFACWRIGAICVPVNWRLAVPEIAYTLSDCQPKALFHTTEFTENAETAAKQYGEHVMLVEAADAMARSATMRAACAPPTAICRRLSMRWRTRGSSSTPAARLGGPRAQ